MWGVGGCEGGGGGLVSFRLGSKRTAGPAKVGLAFDKRIAFFPHMSYNQQLTLQVRYFISLEQNVSLYRKSGTPGRSYKPVHDFPQLKPTRLTKNGVVQV